MFIVCFLEKPYLITVANPRNTQLETVPAMTCLT